MNELIGYLKDSEEDSEDRVYISIGQSIHQDSVKNPACGAFCFISLACSAFSFIKNLASAACFS